MSVQSVNLLQQRPGVTVKFTTETGSSWYLTILDTSRETNYGWIRGLLVVTNSSHQSLAKRALSDVTGQAYIRVGEQWLHCDGHSGVVAHIEILVAVS